MKEYRKKVQELLETVFLLIGIMCGAITGVVLMCMLQINRINAYERKIFELQKELNEILGEDEPDMGI